MSIFTYIKSHSVLAGTIVTVAVVGTVIAGRVASRNKAVENTGSNVTRVSLVDVSTFRQGFNGSSADGIVESVSQADIKSQVSAPLAALNVSVGDRVYAGQIIAELQNADIRAQLDQARASAAFSQGQGQTGSISTDSARRSAMDKVRDSYVKGDTAVHSDLDQFLYSSTGSGSTLSSLITDATLSDRIRSNYIDLKSSFITWKTSADSLTSDSTVASIRQSIAISRANLDKISTLLNDVSSALNQADQNTNSTLAATLASWKAIVGADRNVISAAISSLTQAETSLIDAGTVNASAIAGVKALEAQLAKTIIRSPINGTVASAPLRIGELASPGQLIATIVGGGGLQVKAYASGEDLSRISRGARVIIENNIAGTVTNVAPSVNQINKKVEVAISVTNPGSSGLVVGQNVHVIIETGASASNGAMSETYYLPIQNVKIVPGDAYVFTVSSDNKIVRVPVILGEVRGDFVEVKSGLTDDMKIVSPVYELNEGQEVEVQ